MEIIASQKMNYVDGNLIRGNYKAANWQAKPSGLDKAKSFANNAGYVVGMANTLRTAYPMVRPALQGLGMIA